MKPSLWSARKPLFGLFALLLAGQALAGTGTATITWNPPVTIAGDTDVSTLGVLKYAVRFYLNASSDPTINGVTFSAPGSNLSVAAPNYQDLPGDSPAGMSAAYAQLLTSWLAGITSVRLNNLTVGHLYQLQVWSEDSRVGAGGADPAIVNSGPYVGDWTSSINMLFLNVNVNNSGYGQYAIGTFTADATTNQLAFQNYWKMVNALQLRDITALVTTTTTLAASVNPSTNGQTVVFTATVKTNGVAATAATGRYAFTLDGVTVANSSLSGGSATYTTSTLTGGAHTLQAAYTGDVTYGPSTNTLAQTNSMGKDILTASFAALGTASISGTNVSLVVPIGTAVTSLAPTFTVSPFAVLSPASGSAHDFSSPVSYTVTALDGTTKTYLVSVQSYAAWAYSSSFYLLTTTNGAYLAASASVTNFPVLVRLNANTFNFAQAQTNGADIRFADTNGVPLAYQIEQWDVAHGLAAVWVKVPVIAGNASQLINMYCGKANAASESNSTNVFNAGNGYVTVIHLGETLQDEAGSIAPVNSGSTLDNGMIGKCRHMAMGSGIDCGNLISNYPYNTNALTAECWFRYDDNAAVGGDMLNFGHYPYQYIAGTGGSEVDLGLFSPASIGVNNELWNVKGTTVPLLGQWYHAAYVFTSTSSLMYVNGRQEGSNSGKLALPRSLTMKIGGWRNSYNFAGDVDEVRVSSVARSTNWLWLEYQNQNPAQTLVGSFVQAGTNFSVSATNVTMLEGGTINLVGQAGGAQNVFWILKQNGQSTVLCSGQYTLNYSPGRLVGDQSYILEFVAVYASGTKTTDVNLTVQEAIPDPIYTLVPSTNLWDGRQTLTVAPNVSNWSAIVTSGATNFSYRWRVSGVAVIPQSFPTLGAPGVITNAGPLTLLRSQGSGPMVVTLVLDNGGVLVTNSTTVMVQEPASDAWVTRTPDANEVPVNNQFFARDDTGYGTIFYNGTLGGSPSSVFLRVYANGLLATNYSQTLTNGAYAFRARIAGGLVNYSVQFGSVTGGVTNVLNTVTNLVCGDAYVIDGQSNAVADNNDANPTAYPNITYYTNTWIRSFGTIGSGTDGGWGLAVASSASGLRYFIGYWGMDLASNLVATYSMPVCILNGAVGGTFISMHQANPVNHLDNTAPYTYYGNLMSRVAGARLTHGVRAVLWHQGENDSGSGDPTGLYNYQSYQQYFVNMSAAWKQDMPNLKHYYVFQIFPAPCGMGPNVVGDMVREVQRTLPRLYSNMSLMETIGGPNYGKGMCHWGIVAYQVMANNIAPLVARDNYGLVPGRDITAPNLTRAWYAATNPAQIALQFSQNVAWNSAATANLYLDNVNNSSISSGVATNNVITLRLAGTSTYQTISYVLAQYWDANTNSLLLGSNGIAALTFSTVPILSGPNTNSPAMPTGLSASGMNHQVFLSWAAAADATSYNVKRSLTDGGPYAWVGTVGGTTYTDNAVVNDTTYYYVVSATNSVAESTNSTQVSAMPMVPPVPAAPAALNAVATNAQVILTWSPSAYATAYNLKRSQTNGGPYTVIYTTSGTGYVDSGIITNTSYYYVVSAFNSTGESVNSIQATVGGTFGSIALLPATAVTSASATLNATLASPATNYTVTAFWNTVNGGTSPALWTNSALVGSFTNVASTNLSFTVTGLPANTTFFFAFQATNAGSVLWPPSALSFTTLALPGPGVDNAMGATNLAIGVAQLRATLSNGPANVRLCWGTTDGGTTLGAWPNTILVSNAPSGAVSANVSNLLYGPAFYYRAYASNQWGNAWAPGSTNFTTLRPASTLANSAASGLTLSTATLNATLACTGAVYDVVAYWNTVNGGTNAALWVNSAYIGSCTNVTATNLSYSAAGLAPGTPYYFTFRATNALDSLWAANVQAFTTLTPPAPTVDNAAGATNLVVGIAQLRGTLANGPADVRLYWGPADGGTTQANWAGATLLAGTPSGSFTGYASNLFYGLTYYYRAYASNQWGSAWAPATASFTTLRPTGAPAGQIPFSNIVAVSASSEMSGYEAVNAFDGAGLQANGTHLTSGEWVSGGSTVGNEWLKVRFDQSYNLDYLRVWAFNEGPEICVTNATVYVITSDTDPGTNAHLNGLPFNPTGWTALLPNQAFTPNPGSGSGPETNTDPHISLNGVAARQLALKINKTANDVGIAGFAELQVYRLAPTPISLTNSAATGVTATTAGLNGVLGCVGAAYNVLAYWGTVNGGTNPGLWGGSGYVGSWTNASLASIASTATGLAPSTTYYFTLCATNIVDNLWATNVQSFTTLASTTPLPPVLPVSGVTVSNGVPYFSFSAAGGCMYRLDYKNALTDAAWSYGGWSTNTTGGPLPMTLTDPSAAGQPQRFYRLEAATP